MIEWLQREQLWNTLLCETVCVSDLFSLSLSLPWPRTPLSSLAGLGFRDAEFSSYSVSPQSRCGRLDLLRTVPAPRPLARSVIFTPAVCAASASQLHFYLHGCSNVEKFNHFDAAILWKMLKLENSCTSFVHSILVQNPHVLSTKHPKSSLTGVIHTDQMLHHF